MEDLRVGSCPKCHHNRTLHITQVADRVGDQGGVTMNQGDRASPEVGQFYPWRIARIRNPGAGLFTSDVMAAGLVEAFVCAGCGFTELYTRKPSSIAVDGKIVREIAGPEPEGPYR